MDLKEKTFRASIDSISISNFAITHVTHAKKYEIMEGIIGYESHFESVWMKSLDHVTVFPGYHHYGTSLLLNLFRKTWKAEVHNVSETYSCRDGERWICCKFCLTHWTFPQDRRAHLLNFAQTYMWAHHLWHDLLYSILFPVLSKAEQRNSVCFCCDCFLLRHIPSFAMSYRVNPFSIHFSSNSVD